MNAVLGRSLPACAAAIVAFAVTSLPCAASPASVVMADGSVRYEFGRRPQPVLVCKPRYVCDISLDSGETVSNIAIGDAAHWIIAAGQSGPNGATTPHVFVKPTEAALDTNLVITTTKRTYDVALRSAPDAKNARMSFFYADEDAAAKAAIAERQRIAIDAVLAGNPQVGLDGSDTKYRVSGDTALAPDRVFNDGARTFVAWKTLPVTLPVVVSVAKDGSFQRANFRVVGTTYVIDSLDPNFDLVVSASPDRRGQAERRVAVRHL